MALLVSGPLSLYAGNATPKFLFTERSDLSTPGAAVSTWRLQLLDLEPGTEFSIAVANHLGCSTSLPGRFTVDADGTVLHDSRPMMPALGPCFWGERFTYIAASIDDGREIAKTTIVPFPILESDGKGHAVEVIPIGLDGEVFKLVISGFKDDQDVDIQSISEGEVLTWKAKGKDLSHMLICPSVIGKETGIVTVVFNSNLKVTWTWGAKSTAPVDRLEWLRICESRSGS